MTTVRSVFAAFGVFFLFHFHYRPQRSWGKVISLQASVILSTGGCLLLGGLVPGGALSGGAWSSGVCSQGVPGLGGACSRGGVPGPGGGVCSWRGACSWGGGAWFGGVCAPGGCAPREEAWWRPPGMATAAGGTHPT